MIVQPESQVKRDFWGPWHRPIFGGRLPQWVRRCRPAFHVEYSQPAAFAETQVTLATAALSTPDGIAACLLVFEVFVHRRRLFHRALLLEKPTSPWIETQLEALHTQVGCQRHPVAGRSEASPDLAKALAQLPWSAEWLVTVLDRIPAAAMEPARQLAALWQAQRNALVEAHIGLVVHVLRRRGPVCGVAREDLIQEGLVGLCRAVERFDPNRGSRLSSYAVPVIRHAMAQVPAPDGTRVWSPAPAWRSSF